MFKQFFAIFVLATFSVSTADADYLFGLYPENNSTQEIQTLENYYGYRAPVVGFIFDSFDLSDADFLKKTVSTLGTDRVYHITLSPFGYSAKQVAEGEFDLQYTRLFQTMKKSGANFVFRTMHEMNGSWFSWSGDPASFKLAYIRIWNLSRSEWLDRSNILFTFSVNLEDLPSKGGKIGGDIIYCNEATRKKTWCARFEDFYPGDNYVDLGGLSLYNWGRARNATWAKWQSFDTLLRGSKMRAFERLKAYKKPIFLDEVGTTAVNFDGAWSKSRVQEIYKKDTVKKNLWITHMRETLNTEPTIVGALYFNRDRTQWLTDWSRPEELDWRALSIENGPNYLNILEFFTDSRMHSSALVFEKKPSPVRVPNIRKKR